MRIPSRNKHLLFVLIALITTVVATEGILQIMYRLSPTAQFHLSLPGTVSIIHDDLLQWRGHPGHPEHDRNGFRNKSVPPQADIVALGDSQTYGYSVEPHQAWPQQLAQISGVTSYTMAYGGYGPVHSLLLWDEVTQLEPKLVIEAMYSGNDLFEAFKLVYYQNKAPELKSTDPALVQAINKAESIETIKDEIDGVYWMGSPPVQWQPSGPRMRQIISQHCRLYGLLRAVKLAAERTVNAEPTDPDFQTDWQANKQSALSNSGYCVAFEYDSFKTVMNPLCRSYSVNLDDPRIAEGHRIALRANRHMAMKAQKAGIQYLVVLIPTKELVFKNVVRRSGQKMPPAYDDVIEREEQMWLATKQYFREHHIPFVDPLDALRQRLTDRHQPFFMSLDTHLNPEGHRTIARLLQTQLTGNKTLHLVKLTSVP